MFLSKILSGLQRMSILKCGDNSGVIKGCIIGLGRNKHGTGKIGDRIKVSVRDKTSDCIVNNKKPRGIIVRRKKETQRKDGMVFKFDENAFVIISNNKLQATKIKGPILLETRHNSKSLASKIL
ncbi:Ribosomal protein L14p/L23e family protein [Theileria parva strain Muguga]|uniref:50S ribosomal protein L14, putative n=1 Tax=Theileria parva TaxID=5875 RepID=Q4N2F7_THEPA|nr:Ribosomal protein L14p/L23e family protein [Theileria parva strain Muguga]EAN31744.1 Ribosomal protein L14p/L23e family protein [Theileria parva strain Muguga]|eukprot:XP_764027.1 50S ribosomal protein L14 [Theileria parva strain Muguga]